MSETSEQFAKRPIWEPYENILVTAENLDSIKAEFQQDLRIGDTCQRRKPEYYFAQTGDVFCWIDADGVRWIPYGEHRRRM